MFSLWLFPYGQVHPFKPAAGTVHIGNTVTLAQMLPPRTQAVVYTANTVAQFPPTARITITSTAQNQARPHRPMVLLTRV